MANASAAQGEALSIEHVGHRYGRNRVIDDVSLTVEPGRILCLVGPSGCGKSTLLRIAAGLEELQEGTIRVGDTVVADPAGSIPPERRRIGLVFQDYALFPHLTVLENVRFGLGRNDAAGERRARETLETVGMAAFAQAYPHTLSGGQQQRVALARALAPQPRVLLLDEPFSGLDTRLRQQVRDETLHVLKRNGAATLVVTHDPEEAMFLADAIALMRDGRIVQLGTPTDLYCRPVNAFAATFFGEANRLEGRVAGGAVATPVGAIAAANLAEGTPAEVLIRPEALLIDAGPGATVSDRARPSPPAQALSAVPARVEAARLLGRTSLVHLSVDGPAGTAHLHARAPGLFLPEEGARVGVRVDPAQAFVFARDTAV